MFTETNTDDDNRTITEPDAGEAEEPADLQKTEFVVEAVGCTDGCTEGRSAGHHSHVVSVPHISTEPLGSCGFTSSSSATPRRHRAFPPFPSVPRRLPQSRVLPMEGACASADRLRASRCASRLGSERPARGPPNC